MLMWIVSIVSVYSTNNNNRVRVRTKHNAFGFPTQTFNYKVSLLLANLHSQQCKIGILAAETGWAVPTAPWHLTPTLQRTTAVIRVHRGEAHSVICWLGLVVGSCYIFLGGRCGCARHCSWIVIVSESALSSEKWKHPCCDMTLCVVCVRILWKLDIGFLNPYRKRVWEFELIGTDVLSTPTHPIRGWSQVLHCNHSPNHRPQIIEKFMGESVSYWNISGLYDCCQAWAQVMINLKAWDESDLFLIPCFQLFFNFYYSFLHRFFSTKKLGVKLVQEDLVLPVNQSL